MFLLLAWLVPRESTGREKERERKKAKTVDGVAFKGKFTGHTGERCTWTANGEERYTLKVTCLVTTMRKPVSSYTCEYTGELALCPSFITRPHAFWKQISRELQQQKQHLCRDARKTIKARMCKSGPRAAHFRLVGPSKEITLTTPVMRTGIRDDTLTTECTRRADHRQLAREKCGGSWANFCNFLFQIVQSGDC
ncbi:Fibroblast growth factor-binding protein 1 [Bagarius yarrelli]|uniref:Fibroblast growth factor-binding protein 1 n=1 Tax=Bagarius yarrelli TaxID=175774 RepID=A0A556UG05_BAGYA|nr:Fibroblast growth factor-binding protein 1 [Bagarius yarrelli]